MPKRPIREKLLAERRHLSAETCLHLSLLVQTRLLDSESFQRAQCVGLYSPTLNEVHTELVAQRCLSDGKRLAYPRVRGQTLQFVEVDSGGTMAPGSFGICEPMGDRLVSLAELDLLIVPGIAFDLAGNRLGFGKGYYDRALAGAPPCLERVGFAFEFQVVEQLPVADHDCRLTQLVTEQRMFRCPSGDKPDLSTIPRRGGAGC